MGRSFNVSHLYTLMKPVNDTAIALVSLAGDTQTAEAGDIAKCPIFASARHGVLKYPAFTLLYRQSVIPFAC